MWIYTEFLHSSLFFLLFSLFIDWFDEDVFDLCGPAGGGVVGDGEEEHAAAGGGVDVDYTAFVAGHDASGDAHEASGGEGGGVDEFYLYVGGELAYVALEGCHLCRGYGGIGARRAGGGAEAPCQIADAGH